MNKNNGLIITLLVVLIILVGYVAFKTNIKISPVVNGVSQNASDSSVKVVEKVDTSSEATVASDLKTYVNTQYGFSFKYPSSWKLNENLSKKEVTINTSTMAEGSKYPSWSITFKATDKTFFNIPISTKYGQITYDQKQLALVDGDSCLKSEKLLGNFIGNNATVQSIRYGGSLMSDPAYSNEAILTNNGEIIIVTSQQGVAPDSEILAQISKIATSFNLVNSNTVYVPMCSK